jgi:hypothetical protein
MKKIVKSTIYFPAFFPELVLAQVKSNQGSLDRPDTWQFFSSISVFLYIILGGMGALSIIGFFIAAIDYLVAGGDEERVGRSGKIFAFSLVGLALAIIGIVAINIAGETLQK